MSTMSGSGGGGGGGGIGQGMANVGSGLLSGITGFFQRRKAKKALAGLQRPEYQIPNEVLQNQKMAEKAASEGLPSQQYNQAVQNIQRQQSRALSAATSRRGGLMALPGVQQQANDALLGLDVKDAQARMANQQQLYGINSQVGAFRDKAWDINKMQPYQRDYNYNMSLLGMGNQNMLAGADKLLGGAGMMIDSSGKTGSQIKSSKKSTAAPNDDPLYYNGYDANSAYSGFD